MLLTRTALTILVSATLVQGAAGQQMPPGMTHEQHVEQMQKDQALQQRGAEAMGFDQAKTTHHFRLSSTGGTIEVIIRDRADEANRAAIREHLKGIAVQFAAGDFERPLMTHGEIPDGTAEMVKRRQDISYTFELLPDGGRVRIETAAPKALDAVHRFLRYQIREHRTGDSVKVPK